MGIVRNIGGTAGEESFEREAVSLPNGLHYRQIEGAAVASVTPPHRVPVLFSTNRGLYLRLAQPQRAQVLMETSVNALEPHTQSYDIKFCDLERWSTNRANVISLEDTFSVRQHNSTPQSSDNNFQSRIWPGFRSNYSSFGMKH